MDLKDFIAITLTQIAEGVREAQTKSAGVDARINPFLGKEGRSRSVVNVEFKVAVSNASGTATGGTIGVLAGWIGAKSSGESKDSSEAATIIRFTVPVILPSEADPAKHPKPRAVLRASRTSGFAGT